MGRDNIPVLLLALSLGVCAAGQTVSSKPPEPESINVFYYLDSATQTLKRLPTEPAAIHRSTGLSVTVSIVLSGTHSPFRVAAGDKPTFIFKDPTPTRAETARLFQCTVKGKTREYELAKKKGKDETHNRGLAANLINFQGSSYTLTPELPLDPGEYVVTTGTLAFTFGVD